MLQSIQKLKGFRIIATNEKVGTIEEMYFDDAKWVVRCLVVRIDRPIHARAGLMDPSHFGRIDSGGRELRRALLAPPTNYAP